MSSHRYNKEEGRSTSKLYGDGVMSKLVQGLDRQCYSALSMDVNFVRALIILLQRIFSFPFPYHGRNFRVVLRRA